MTHVAICSVTSPPETPRYLPHERIKLLWAETPRLCHAMSRSVGERNNSVSKSLPITNKKYLYVSRVDHLDFTIRLHLIFKDSIFSLFDSNRHSIISQIMGALGSDAEACSKP